MKTPFKNGYKITQKFDENKDYYKQFGLEGHEGLDIIPLDSDWTVYAIEDGVVVRDTDDPRLYDAYGNLVVIWNKERRRAFWYAHNNKNVVKLGQEIKRGQPIAVMGGTGNVTGPHSHIGLRESDDKGNAINLNNGYKGFIDPLPIIEQLNNGEVTELKDTEIDFMDAEGHTHTVGWYVREWWLEKQQKIKEVENNSNKQGIIEDQQTHIKELLKYELLWETERKKAEDRGEDLKRMAGEMRGLNELLAARFEEIKILKAKCDKNLYSFSKIERFKSLFRG